MATAALQQLYQPTRLAKLNTLVWDKKKMADDTLKEIVMLSIKLSGILDDLNIAKNNIQKEIG
jgi:hypothetical protein